MIDWEPPNPQPLHRALRVLLMCGVAKLSFFFHKPFASQEVLVGGDPSLRDSMKRTVCDFGAMADKVVQRCGV